MISMKTSVTRPSVARRLAAILSIALVVAVAIATLVLALDRVGPLVAVLALDAVIVLIVWYSLTRAGTARLVAALLGIAAVAAVAAVVVSESAGWSLVWRLALLVVATALARYAVCATCARSRAARRSAHRCLRPSTVCSS